MNEWGNLCLRCSPTRSQSFYQGKKDIKYISMLDVVRELTELGNNWGNVALKRSYDGVNVGSRLTLRNSNRVAHGDQTESHEKEEKGGNTSELHGLECVEMGSRD